MKTVRAAVGMTAASVLTPGVAHAGAPDYLIGIPLKYWILLLVILAVLNLICCWSKRR